MYNALDGNSFRRNSRNRKKTMDQAFGFRYPENLAYAWRLEADPDFPGAIGNPESGVSPE
jgi:hypothetical protein